MLPLFFCVRFPGKRIFRVFAFFLLYYNCNILAPRVASLAPLRAFFARFARGMVNRDGILPAAVSASNAAPLAASRNRCRHCRPVGDCRPVRPMRHAQERHGEGERPARVLPTFIKFNYYNFIIPGSRPVHCLTVEETIDLLHIVIDNILLRTVIDNHTMCAPT